MRYRYLTPQSAEFPALLGQIPQPAQQLYVCGADLRELLARPRVAIVGSRKASAYGKAVTAQLGLALAQAGVVIVSGLALGIDSLAHKAALEVGAPTIAVLPCGPDRIYPASHYQLARQIVAQGGALVTEYDEGREIYPSNFIERNRLASGLCDSLLIVEAAERSGTLSTARFALEQGREVLVVPGNITSPTSAGTNTLIKAGATPVTGIKDILHALGLEVLTANQRKPVSGNEHEQRLIDLLHTGMSDGAILLARSGLDVRLFNQTLTMLEITGVIRALGGNQWALR